MHFDVEHLTDYRYGSPVYLGPQTLRMRPRPGGGLREIDYSLLVDPTRGILVGAGHVPVAAAPEPSGAMPVEGSYFGAAGSRLRYEVRIRAGGA